MTKFENLLLRFLGVFMVVYMNKNMEHISPLVHNAVEKFLEQYNTEINSTIIKE